MEAKEKKQKELKENLNRPENTPSLELINKGFEEQAKKMLDGSKYPDFFIKVEDLEMKCHKCYLSSSNNFFDRLISNKIKEDKFIKQTSEDTVEIKMIRKDTIKNIIQYLYQGYIGFEMVPNKVEHNIIELYVVR